MSFLFCRFEMLLRLFNGLDSALRLLRMRKTVPFFSRIRAVVESITGRLNLGTIGTWSDILIFGVFEA